MLNPIWTPAIDQIGQANMMHFINRVRRDYSIDINDYSSLYHWSINKPREFWPAVWRYCDIEMSKEWDDVLVNDNDMLKASWFNGCRFNFAENLLCRRDEHPALIFRNEKGKRREISHQKLYQLVAQTAHALRNDGVRAGDRIVGYLPNMPESVIVMLATTSIGATWSSCSPDFGTRGVMDRFSQIKPKILFSADGYFYNGKWIDLMEKNQQLSEQLSTVEKIIVIPFTQNLPDCSRLNNAVIFNDYISNQDKTSIKFEQLPFDHPLYIVYSSGTTGVPKCIVHGAGGTLIQHLKELVLHTDLKPDDRLFFFTTCGWMMWNWLVSGLATGATVILYDGSPLYPSPETLFDIAEQEDITIFGAGAKYFSAIEKAGIKPIKTHSLGKLKSILSTGSPLSPESFDYIYRDIKNDIHLASISGGTDIISCFALGNPTQSVYRGELQCRGLGMKVEVFNKKGELVQGQKGELVCTSPFPSMPICFWNDPDQKKYHEAYFEKFPDVWAHGDYVELTEHGGIIIYGRCDAVLNPGGIRIGTAEIYREVESVPEVIEAVAITQKWQNDVRIILFVKLQDGVILDADFTSLIKNTIRENTTRRHVPAKVIQVTDIPRTFSGKIAELAVSDIIHNRTVKNIEALDNPESLECFRNLEELQTE
jgi:acetoacetyl-CoA synthetase